MSRERRVPDLRLEAVRQLNLAGVDAGVICAPVLPEITDRPRDLEALVKAASEAGAKYIFANPLFLKPCSAAMFMPFLEQHFPALVEIYRKRYEDRAFLPKGYGERLSQLMAALRRKYGIDNQRLHATVREPTFSRRTNGVVLKRPCARPKRPRASYNDWLLPWLLLIRRFLRSRPENNARNFWLRCERRAGAEPALVAV